MSHTFKHLAKQFSVIVPVKEESSEKDSCECSDTELNDSFEEVVQYPQYRISSPMITNRKNLCAPMLTQRLNQLEKQELPKATLSTVNSKRNNSPESVVTPKSANELNQINDLKFELAKKEQQLMNLKKVSDENVRLKSLIKEIKQTYIKKKDRKMVKKPSIN